jgi:uncharacterized caspase-like protein
MMPSIIRYIVALAFAASGGIAFAETRVALVIGNAAYKHAPALANPKNDAEGMAASLRRLGFEVVAGTDLDKPAMERLLRDFAQKIEKADVALVFYAGRGLQVHGRNHLIPIDAKLDTEADLLLQAVPLDLILEPMRQERRANVMIAGACRNDSSWSLLLISSSSAQGSSRLDFHQSVRDCGTGTMPSR